MNCVTTDTFFVVSTAKLAPGPYHVWLPSLYGWMSQPFLSHRPSKRWSGLSPQSLPSHRVCSLAAHECVVKADEMELASLRGAGGGSGWGVAERRG
jgi:hypothetical protein